MVIMKKYFALENDMIIYERFSVLLQQETAVPYSRGIYTFVLLVTLKAGQSLLRERKQ